MDAMALMCPVGASAAAFACAFGAMGHESKGRSSEAGLSGLDEVLRSLPIVKAVELRQTARRRRADALKQMPALLDITTLGLSAGLSFDASLELYCQRYHTSLASSFNEALLSWRIGTSSRGEALEGLANEMDVSALRRFASAVTEALAFGTPLAAALEQQAQAIRDEQRSQIEEEIEKVPVKMLIPLGTLILPAMLLAILGPLLGPALGI